MKFNTQNAKITATTEKTLVIGIDVGSETHFARVFNWRGYEFSRKPLEFGNTEEGFETLRTWIMELKEKHGMDKVIPGMEPTGHYWFNLGKFLQDKGMRPVHVNPHHVKKSKEMDDNDPSKNDRKDPKVIAGLVNEGRYFYPYIPDGIYAEIRALSELQVLARSEITRLKNRIARWFSIYFPNYKDVYGNVGAVSGLMVLKEAPLPEDIVKLEVDGVNRIWRDAKLRGVGLKRARTLVTAAEHSVGSREAQEAARIELRILLADYERYTAREKELMALIEEKIGEVPYVDKLLEIRGIGLKTVIGFVAEVGDIKRFDNPKQLQKLAGYAIVRSQSGKHKGESHISYRGRKRLRYVLYEAAVSVVSHSPEFRSIHRYYTTRDRNPLKKMQSLIAVACKLIRVFYLILQTGATYKAEKMMEDIRRPAAV
ncbi:Transposase IS116/IS110/IS902 family protein [Sarcina sp. DSM 11001]|uniref:IS110 family transposase n=1 Tax=Sarcina sp. DSM 11001 TaxID=1798184 RepID=UPI000881AF9D|nr:IS110 family transposase [Sarcina sp. DSM 11001]SDK34943.1 Transposase IS116/IS110/IS902 family protein [Sarcina sp. DSM 11001]